MYQKLFLKPGFACKFNFPYKSECCMLISEFLKARQNSRGSTKFPIGQSVKGFMSYEGTYKRTDRQRKITTLNT